MGHSPLIARVCSDLHLDACPMNRPSGAVADLALVPGDALNGKGDPERLVDALESLFSEPLILFTPGNHEGYGAHDWDAMVERLRKASSGTRVQILHRDTLTHHGRRFLGATLWTNFRYFGMAKQQASKEAASRAIHDYKSIRVDGSLITPQTTIDWHTMDLAFLERELALPFDGPTIVMTHHAPHQNSVAPKYALDLATGAFASRLPEALIEKAALWVHGHMHASFDYPVGRGRVLCNPRGYSRETYFSTENYTFTPDVFVQI